MGTPKNLKEVMSHIQATPLIYLDYQGPLIIKDFLSQKFSVAFLKAKNKTEVDLLKKLWESIINEESI